MIISVTRVIGQLLGLFLFVTLTSYAAGPTTWTFTLASNGSTYVLTPPAIEFSESTSNAINEPITIVVKCNGGGSVSCANLAVGVKNTAGGIVPLIAEGGGTSASTSYTLKQADVSGSSKDKPVMLVFKVSASGALPAYEKGYQVHDAKGENKEDKKDGNPSPTSLIECLRGRTFRGDYQEKANRALFIVTTAGNVLARPPMPVDEDDEIIVRVVGLKSELNGLQVKQTSAFRDGTALRILGDAPATSSNGVTKQGAADDACGEMTISAGNGFDPGKGTIELSRLKDSESVIISSFDFVVNPLYAGAFSFGPAYSKLGDYTYGYVASGGDTTLTITNRESPRVHYVIAYTPFIWGSRDVAKLKSLKFYEHFNPTIALTVQNTFDNAFVGISGDLFRNSAFFTVGQHVGRVTRLDPNSGLSVGDKLSPGKRTIPTVKSWENDWFFSVTIDLRAALRFFNAGVASAPR